MLTVSPDPTARIWDDYRRGLLTWAEVQRLERELMPRCASCNEPTNARIADGPICPTCMDALYRLVSNVSERIAYPREARHAR